MNKVLLVIRYSALLPPSPLQGISALAVVETAVNRQILTLSLILELFVSLNFANANLQADEKYETSKQTLQPRTFLLDRFIYPQGILQAVHEMTIR